MPNWVSSDFVTSVLNREDSGRVRYFAPASPEFTTQQDIDALTDGLIESGYLSRPPVIEPPPKRQEYTVICLWFAHNLQFAQGRWYWDYAAPPDGPPGSGANFGFHYADGAINEAERFIAHTRRTKILIEFGLPTHYGPQARARFPGLPNE